MRVSELIKNLQKEMDKCGDLLVAVYDSESFAFSSDVTLSIEDAKENELVSMESDGDNLNQGNFIAIMDSIFED